ncbi:cation:proton antiporter [Streptomyces sp. NPDC014986]|uniref:cation:proton antiporter n=1 Tax=Streptomyces sp. NPDC014986 TaxID=3364934 RepID=UPI0036F6CC44
MPATAGTTAQLLCALTALLVAAHTMGQLFARLRQPQVIGEILGGLLLGPVLLGMAAPGAQRWLLPSDGPVAGALSAFSTLGLLLLVHFTGADLHRGAGGARRNTIVLITVIGLVLPFAVGLGMANLTDLSELSGPNGSTTTLTLVFGMAIAVTSVPVISRIMLDLGILESVFARIVLAVAVAEDVVLYVVLAVVLGLTQAGSSGFPLWQLLSQEAAPPVAVYAYYAVVPVVFLTAVYRLGPALYGRTAAARANLVARRSPMAYRLLFVLLLCAACSGLGIDPIFGAVTSGMCVARAGAGSREGAPVSGGSGHRERDDGLRSFALSVFVPVYFALVGVQLDLAHHFDFLFLCWFLALACAAKSFSVWLGARLAGERNTTAVNLAVAMNARGGPGIVLASVTHAAGIIDRGFFTTLVLLSVITSYLAGQWLGRAVTRGIPLTEEDAPGRAPHGPRESDTGGRRPATASHSKEHLK